MLRFYLGKAFKLPVVGRIYAGISWPLRRVVRCDRCQKPNVEAGIIIGVLIGWLLLRWWVRSL